MRQIICILFLLTSISPTLAQAPPPGDSPALKNIAIAMLRDGPSDIWERYLDSVKSELLILTEGQFNVTFKESPRFAANWDTSRLEQVLRNALSDPEVDLVFATGILVTHAAVHTKMPLSKPVISALAAGTKTLGLPFSQKDRSEKPNLVFAVVPESLGRDLETFHRMIGFKSLHILLEEKLLEMTPDLSERLKHDEGKFSFDITLVPTGASASEILENLGQSVEAVYLTPSLRLPLAERQKLILSLNEKKIPTFSMIGHIDVQRGVLAGLRYDLIKRMSRRIALNCQQIMLGVSPNDLPVLLSVGEHLLINDRTADQIGYSPDFETLAIADFLNNPLLESGKTLTLDDAVTTALKNNIEIDISQARLNISQAQRRKALSSLFPQAATAAEYLQIDGDRALTSFNAILERNTTAGVSVQQMLFDDQVISTYRSARKALKGTEHETEATRLDVIESAAKNYFEFLSSRTLLKIQLENYNLTKSNLELARLREKVGAAGPEEGYRWEAASAADRSAVFEQESSVAQALIALNQTLGIAQEISWVPKDIALSDDDYYFLGKELKTFINNLRELEAFHRFVVHVALRNSPELQAFDKFIEAQAITLGFAKRRYILPSVNANFSYTHHIDRDFPQPQLLEQKSNRDDWVFGLSATYPLFEGGGKAADVERARAELRELKSEREQLAQLVEKRVQTALLSMESSHPNIALSRHAAKHARKNLEVVREKYAMGTVNIVDLLDAQNQAFTQGQEAAIAAYDYLEDLIEFQRALSWFEIDKSSEERAQFIRDIEEFIQSQIKKQKTL